MLISLKWRRGMLSMFLLGIAYLAAFSQARTVTGTVTSGDAEPLPGVNIVIQGTTQGAVTDMDGHYSIDVAGPDAVILFSYIGYTTLAVPVEDKSIIDPVLRADVTALDEIVVTGYTSMRRGDITGAVAIVDMEEMNQITSASVLQKLEGRAAGVQVNVNGQPGSR
ncbi:MAG: carboxypeptidase-like regulatory domain-containing protein, partial [Bacteroidales bacterium]|nr:carboxypeptidase-like regulatory domain-containing protein [Bacteroidales bacterium]